MKKEASVLSDPVRLWFLVKLKTHVFSQLTKTFADSSDLPLIDFRTSISHMDFPKIVEGGFKQMLELLGDDDEPFDVGLFSRISPSKYAISS